MKLGGPSTTVPSFIHRIRSTIVLRRSIQIPTWSKLWIGPDGLVRVARIRAQSHFMDDRYFDFNGDNEIEPPQP